MEGSCFILKSQHHIGSTAFFGASALDAVIIRKEEGNPKVVAAFVDILKTKRRFMRSTCSKKRLLASQ
ncbi:hypothetical protein MKW98_000713 [Papaver atlanticum]|uniref:Uncharacterized protein n=1 Tax=Papaver atlanticum TaxID=357466 RepID=A0AAD4SDS8_9MAGN|nr:hypothetical protein MKW98_000713 [Papaver atlanticum]